MKKRTVTDSRRQRQIAVVIIAAGIAAAIQEFVLKPGLKGRIKI